MKAHVSVDIYIHSPHHHRRPMLELVGLHPLDRNVQTENGSLSTHKYFRHMCCISTQDDFNLPKLSVDEIQMPFLSIPSYSFRRCRQLFTSGIVGERSNKGGVAMPLDDVTVLVSIQAVES